jgi:hypothetical protein
LFFVLSFCVIVPFAGQLDFRTFAALLDFRTFAALLDFRAAFRLILPVNYIFCRLP